MEPLNQITPRIFVAATRQDDGKTTTSLGLLGSLLRRMSRVGYIKPVGQRYVIVDGRKIDEDSVLIDKTFDIRLPLEAMSPIAVESGFTRQYIEQGGQPDLPELVVRAFNRAAWEKDFVIIEGTGHAGVGSVIDLSNARVASLLRSKVIIVSQGGVGKPIDEISLNLALFEKAGVEVIGVVLNKVLPAKIESLWPVAEKGLARLGLPLLGIVPLSNELRKPTLNQIARELKATFLSGDKMKRRRVSRVVIGTASSRHAHIYIEPGSLLITAGDRDDLLRAIFEAPGGGDNPLAGVVLTDEFPPEDELVDLLKARGIPCLVAQHDCYTIASKINGMTVKTEPGDQEKIEMIRNLIGQNVDIPRIVASATPSGEDPQQMRLPALD
ncbi:MAG: AAA family ATPase [Candidatus Methylacidiphilales bacterium]